MRSGAAALAYAKNHRTIPYNSVSSIDGVTRTIDDLECARSVMAAFDVMPIGDMGTATRMWQRTTDKRSGTPANGAPLFFPNYGAGKSGHVAIYDAASGQAWTTPVWLRDVDAYSTCHLISIADLAAKCGNPYAGWGADIAGKPIDFTSTAGSGSKPFPEPEEKKKRKADRMLINIWNTNPKTVGYRGATVGETTIEVQKAPTVLKAKARAERLYSYALEVTQEEFDGYVADVNARRAQLGLAPIIWPTA